MGTEKTPFILITLSLSLGSGILLRSNGYIPVAVPHRGRGWELHSLRC